MKRILSAGCWKSQAFYSFLQSKMKRKLRCLGHVNHHTLSLGIVLPAHAREGEGREHLIFNEQRSIPFLQPVSALRMPFVIRTFCRWCSLESQTGRRNQGQKGNLAARCHRIIFHSPGAATAGTLHDDPCCLEELISTLRVGGCAFRTPIWIITIWGDWCFSFTHKKCKSGSEISVWLLAVAFLSSLILERGECVFPLLSRGGLRLGFFFFEEGRYTLL